MQEEIREFRLKGLRPSAEALMVFELEWICINARRERRAQADRMKTQCGRAGDFPLAELIQVEKKKNLVQSEHGGS